MNMRTRWLPLLILLIVSALTYLPFISRFTYANDDWYLMYGAHVQGSDYFAPAYERDRPMRAYVLGPAYDMFGDQPLPYHISAYVFRLLGAISLFWLLNQLWAKNRTANLLASLLFVVYPGFLSQPNPIDYQSQILSLFAALASFALTVAALKTEKMSLRVVYIVLSILLAWIYLGLIEYYLGLEVLRLAAVYLVIQRRTKGTVRIKLWAMLKAWLPFAAGPLAFLIWRLFFFTSERNATDVGLQFGALFSAPLQTGLWWLARFLQDTVNVLFLAWGVPLYNLAFNLRLSDTWIGFALAFAVAIGAGYFLHLPEPPGHADESGNGWRLEMLWVGLISAMAGLIPVILVNRHVEFFSLSRYTLASSAGAAMTVTAMLYFLSSRVLRGFLACLLIGMAVLTHFANAVNLAQEADAVRNFWWQVSWRVPQIRPGTTLAAQFPASIQEDYILWGAANLIYHPEPQTAQPIEAPVSAVLLTPENITRILAGKGTYNPDRRNTRLETNYDKMLILTQTSPGSCVRVLDGTQPELSASDDPRIMLVASASRLDNVDLNGTHNNPLQAAFGPEPPHAWCWYFQQASLARQRGDWGKAASLGDEALKLGFYPADSVEWMPFMQAYAALGRAGDLKKLSSILGADPFLKEQACSILTGMMDAGALTPEIENQAMEWYCD
jgi:hypothetical protein